MRRVAAMLLALVLVITACGDDEESDQPTSPEPEATTTTAAPAATPATSPEATTTVAPATTMAPTTTMQATSMDANDAIIAAAADYVGQYEGSWNNTTFGSTGSISVNLVEANTDAGFLLIQIDLGGNVFGGEDPDQFVLEIYTQGDGFGTGLSFFLSDESFEIDEGGNFTLTGTAVGLDLPIVITGSVVEDGFEGTYTIEGLAEGTWNAAATG